MKHLLRIERQVYLGGVRLWPLRRRAFGRWYTVGPLSLLRWTQFADALVRLEVDFSLLVRHPRLYVSTLAPLLLTPAPRPQDLARMTDAQAALVMSALSECNDLPYLADQVKPVEGKPSGEAWTLVDAVDFLVEQRPVYTHDQVKNMAAQEFYALMGCISKKIEARQPKEEQDDGFRPMTAEDIAAALAAEEGRSDG